MSDRNKLDFFFEKIGTLLLFSVVIFVLGYIFTSPVLSAWKGEVVIYSRYCEGSGLKKITDCGYENSSFSKKTYKVFPATQTVVEKIGNAFITKFDNCAVFDFKNWRCDNKSMIEGDYIQYFSDTGEYSTSYYQQIPRFLYTYWYIRKML